MRKFAISAFALFLLSIVSALLIARGNSKQPQAMIDETRIVVLGSGTAEVVALLGKDKEIVGVGRTSTYPARLQKDYPIAGYVHRAPAEGILTLKPTHVIGNGKMGPEQTVEVLQQAPDIKLLRTKINENQSDVAHNIRLIGEFLGEADKADKIAKDVEADFAAVTAAASQLTPVKYALVYYYKDKLFASGTGDSILTLGWAKGENVFLGVPRSTEAQKEALLAKDPDVILFYTFSQKRLDEAGKTIADLPGLRETRAYKNDKVMFVSGMVYAMGPRTPQAVNYMIGKLHGEDKKAQLPARAYAPESSLGTDK